MIERNKLADQVYQHLLRMILKGEIAPGRPLQETDLAGRLGVSRTPIREALVRLAEYGVVETRPNLGAVVRQFGREELAYSHQVREALEGLAAELACRRMTAEDFARLDALAEAARDEAAPGYFAAPKSKELDVTLHRLVATRSGNPVLAHEVFRLHDMSRIIMEQLERASLDAGSAEPGECRRILRIEWEQHASIIVALKSGAPAASRRAMTQHIRSICELKVGMMPSRPEDVAGAAPARSANGRGRGRLD